MIKSEFAFSNLKFKGNEIAKSEEHFVLRNKEANRYYFDMLEKENDGLYIQDIIPEGITNEDSRIPRKNI